MPGARKTNTILLCDVGPLCCEPQNRSCDQTAAPSRDSTPARRRGHGERKICGPFSVWISLLSLKPNTMVVPFHAQASNMPAQDKAVWDKLNNKTVCKIPLPMPQDGQTHGWPGSVAPLPVHFRYNAV